MESAFSIYFDMTDIKQYNAPLVDDYAPLVI